MATPTIPNLENEISAGYPEKFEPLFWPRRYKVFYGGRGSGKSTTFARLLLGRAYGTKMRIACFRELQTSIKDSVHLLLRDQIDKTPALFDQIPTAREWPIKADCARPETISYIRRQGFNIEGAEKWQGCVEDRIAHLKGYKHIHVHARCKHLQQELRLYSYKRDRVTNEVLPIVVDKHNHVIDALGYALDGYIQRRGGLGVWDRL